MKRRQVSIVLAGISTAALLTACGASGSRSPVTSPVADSLPTVSPRSTDAMTPSDRSTASSVVAASEAAAEIIAPQGFLAVSIGSAEFSATLADTDTARAFADRLPLTLDMSDVNSNEKAFELAESLPDEPERPGKVSSGDLMLYGPNTIVLFYESFDTTYAYTRIGRLDAPDGVAEALGAGDVTVTFASP
jgi:hypothetical protein